MNACRHTLGRTAGKSLRRIACLACLFCSLLLLSACRSKDLSEEKEKDLEFTVVPEADIPDNLKTIINGRKQQEFQLTYATEDTLYLAVGYGTQKTGGYSIQIPSCYLTQSHIVLKTELIGPSEQDLVSKLESYPYVVIKTEMIDLPVDFR